MSFPQFNTLTAMWPTRGARRYYSRVKVKQLGFLEIDYKMIVARTLKSLNKMNRG